MNKNKKKYLLSEGVQVWRGGSQLRPDLKGNSIQKIIKKKYPLFRKEGGGAKKILTNLKFLRWGSGLLSNEFVNVL